MKSKSYFKGQPSKKKRPQKLNDQEWHHLLSTKTTTTTSKTTATSTAKNFETEMSGIAEYFHMNEYPDSDIDIYFYGLNPEQFSHKVVKFTTDYITNINNIIIIIIIIITAIVT